MSEGPCRVVVLMGGPSGEHGVSLDSGRQVLQHLDPQRYVVKPVTISLEGHWHVPEGYLPPGVALELLGEGGEPSGALVQAGPRMLTEQAADRPDVVFIAMHGPFGEDGTVQGLLETLDLPYVGSGVAASALAIDKPRTKMLYAANGLRTPECLTIHEADWRRDPAAWTARATALIGFPAVCKPATLGSSVALTMVDGPDGLDGALETAFAMDPVAMLEVRVGGMELTCGVLDDAEGVPRALPVTQIVPRLGEYFDYASKYTPGGAEEITPAQIDTAVTARVQHAAVRAHTVLGCAGMSRSDFFVDDGVLWILETNTIPGLTATSLLPQEAAAAGMSFGGMLDGLIADALRRYRARKPGTG